MDFTSRPGIRSQARAVLWLPAQALIEHLLCKLMGRGAERQLGKGKGCKKDTTAAGDRGRDSLELGIHRKSGSCTEGRLHHSEAGKIPRTLLFRKGTPLLTLFISEARGVARTYLPMINSLGTHLKNLGWCSKLFSSKTRRLSLCSCSTLCFCSSASSKFPSSRHLRGKK